MPTCAPSRVYFLNTQKLSRSAASRRAAPNAREFSFWEILAQYDPVTGDLVMVLDEAHRG